MSPGSIESVVSGPASKLISGPLLVTFLLESLAIGLEETEETMVEKPPWRDMERVLVERTEEYKQGMDSIEELVVLGEAYIGKGL